ncbi:FemAB-like protein, PEP-CTERM system-associated [Haloferax mucosum ATCC BAA-1512]|uniref:FemAB-like protein, PEP-CTERM system-associated n=1 Tax=Haloferax mucosum ATCC BAA-1512 TaxID=662479 RepID=M0IQD4_9EURY|nr:GNAT family N-acetyltransferase [Haloferax mucosum]ELZ98023.1 FemAB-like protein, PEP-CTERM system-associated [Haloferax mucosum ATCC BAA-1512]
MSETHRLQTRVTVERCDDPIAWNRFVTEHRGTPYALWGWGDASEQYGHDRHYLVAREGGRNKAGADGEIAGVLPLVHIRSRLFGSKLVSPPYAERGSILTRSGADPAVRDALLDRTRELADALDVEFVSLRGADLGTRPEFDHERRFVTFHIPLDGGSDAVWSRMDDSRQRGIRQAQDAEIEYDVADSLSDLREFYCLNLETMRGHGTPPHSFAFYRTIWDCFFERGHLQLRLIRKDGDVINGLLDFCLGDTVYQWGVVSDYEHRSLNGGGLLHWKSMEWAADHGYRTYELGRTREGTGVYMFKKRFGGRKVWYDDYHYFPNGRAELPDPDDDRYDRLKTVWKRLPLSVTSTVGPTLRKQISL